MPPKSAQPDLLVAATVAQLLQQEQTQRSQSASSAEPDSPWAISDGWRHGHAGGRTLAFQHRGQRIEVTGHGSDGAYAIEHDGRRIDITGARMTKGVLSARFDGEGRRYPVSIGATALDIHDGAQRLRLEPVALYRFERADAGGSGHRVLSPMPGRIVLVKVKAGDAVVEGQEVLVMEAMKMEMSLKAPRDGIVAEVRAASGDVVEGDAALVTLEI